MEDNRDILLLLGRLEGKVDTIVSMHAATAQRVDQLETRTSQLEQQVAAHSAQGSTTSTWITSLISVFALLISALSLFFEKLFP